MAKLCFFPEATLHFIYLTFNASHFKSYTTFNFISLVNNKIITSHLFKGILSMMTIPNMLLGKVSKKTKVTDQFIFIFEMLSKVDPEPLREGLKKS